MRWRLFLWGAVTIYVATDGLLKNDSWQLAVGLALLPAAFAVALCLEGVLALIYLAPERWPALTQVCAFLLIVLAPYLAVAWLLGILPVPPREWRPQRRS